MAAHAKALTRRVKKLGLVGAGSFAVAAAAMTLGLGTAGAEVEEVAPAPEVTSRAAVAINEDGVRLVDIGAARGQGGEARTADPGIVHAQSNGDNAGVRDSVKAVSGSATGPLFEGEFSPAGEGPLESGGPEIGEW
ncbi:hypothetical protein O6P37_02580 [Mycobacterium sp. CPCC 205372]|uniref:Uncharacterized protein n=1 Tax=Mycobacterium hippophais TaxID=3016340 RepID=A0ABT4PME1_9MYCO|nr:hypothetical protein [Mycobacterium hippophais]MCZ8377738.1 hypothetical protein [Mycobacterium hippophais]